MTQPLIGVQQPSIYQGIPGVTLSDFGRDLWCLSDIDPGGAEVSGLLCYAHALFRRLITGRGTLLGDPNYGYDLSQFINDDVTNVDVARIANGVDNEFLKDERTKASRTISAFANGVVTLSSLVTPKIGPTFRMVIAATALTTQLLQVPN